MFASVSSRDSRGSETRGFVEVCFTSTDFIKFCTFRLEVSAKLRVAHFIILNIDMKIYHQNLSRYYTRGLHLLNV